MILAAVVAAMALAVAGCRAERPLLLGFVAGLSGRGAALGAEGRDGVVLAVEQVNRNGGVAGRPVRLLIRDHGGRPDQAAAAVAELADAGAAAVIGPMTSSAAVAAVAVANARSLVLVSPSASTPELSGKDDFFFRVYPDCRQTAALLARHLVGQLASARVAAMLDVTNRHHAEPFLERFVQTLSETAGVLVGVRSYVSSAGADLLGLARQLAAMRPDAVLVLARGVDTALICQHLRRMGSGALVVCSDWPLTPDLFRYGGPAVEGIQLMHTVDPDSRRASFVAFRKAFRQRYGRRPTFAAVHGYDAARMVLAALADGDGQQELKKRLVARGCYDGVQGPICLDGSGDVQRAHVAVEIRGGQLVRRQVP